MIHQFVTQPFSQSETGCTMVHQTPSEMDPRSPHFTRGAQAWSTSLRSGTVLWKAWRMSCRFGWESVPSFLKGNGVHINLLRLQKNDFANPVAGGSRGGSSGGIRQQRRWKDEFVDEAALLGGEVKFCTVVFWADGTQAGDQFGCNHVSHFLLITSRCRWHIMSY